MTHQHSPVEKCCDICLDVFERPCVLERFGCYSGNVGTVIGYGYLREDEGIVDLVAVVVYYGDSSELAVVVGRGAEAYHFAVEGYVFTGEVCGGDAFVYVGFWWAWC